MSLSGWVLIIIVGYSQQHVPFATQSACQYAADAIQSNYRGAFLLCVPDGSKP